MRRKFVFENGQFVDKKTGEQMEKPYAGDICKPMIINQFDGYQSTVTGAYIDDRSKRREEVAAAKDKGLVPFERIDNRPAGLINDAFCKKGGRKTSEATKEWAANKRAKAPKVNKDGAILSE